jgi:hypothetical protein
LPEFIVLEQYKIGGRREAENRKGKAERRK